MSSCDRLAEIQTKWESDMSLCCNVYWLTKDYQKLEQDRFQFLRTHLWNLTNFISGACVLDDESCERTRCALEKCDFQLDLSAFIELRATGTEIPPPLAYVPFSSNISVSQSSISNDSRALVNDMAIQKQPMEFYERSQMSDHTPIVCTGMLCWFSACFIWLPVASTRGTGYQKRTDNPGNRYPWRRVFFIIQMVGRTMQRWTRKATWFVP
jgi:hypothetical protein